MAPEVCAGRGYDGYMTDLYSVGATLYHIRFGRPPFVLEPGCKNIAQLFDQIQHKPLTFPYQVTVGLMDLMQKLLAKSPSMRMTMTEALTFPWLQMRPGEVEAMPPPSRNQGFYIHQKPVEVSDDDIFNSITGCHLVDKHAIDKMRCFL